MSAKYAQLTAARNASSGDAQHSPPPRGSVVSLKAAAAERAVLEHLVAEHVDIETRRSDGGRPALDVENAAKNHRIWRSHAHERSAMADRGKSPDFSQGETCPPNKKATGGWTCRGSEGCVYTRSPLASPRAPGILPF